MVPCELPQDLQLPLYENIQPNLDDCTSAELPPSIKAQWPSCFVSQDLQLDIEMNSADCFASDKLESVHDLFQNQVSVTDYKNTNSDTNMKEVATNESPLFTEKADKTKVFVEYSESLPDTNHIYFTDDSDSCSDYDSDLHEIGLSESNTAFPRQMTDPTFDSGLTHYEFVDEVAEKLDHLIGEGIIPTDHIFYRLLKDITQFINHCGVQHKNDGVKYNWDPLIVDWCNSVLYLGGKRTFNFLRGPVNFQRGKSSSFSLATYNLPLPDERTCRRHAPGYTTEPGIIIELLVYFVKLIMASVVPPVFENNTICLYAVAIGRDGIGLKPELSFDPVC